MSSVNKKAADWRFIGSATAILLLAATMRLVVLSDLPPGLSQDEVLNADIVKFIRGGEHALFFRHGFGHEPLYHYLGVPFQILLGDNLLAIRLPSVFLGIVLVAITIRWARDNYGRLVALVAGLGLAISWWAIIFSRVGIRPVLEAVLLVAAAWAWPRKSWLAGVFLGLSIYSYTAARYIFLLPLGMLTYLLLFHRQDQNLDPAQDDSWRSIRSALVVFLISLAFYVPLGLTLGANPTLQQRVDQLSGPLEALGQGDLEPVASMTMATLGVFSFNGDPRWTYSLPGRPIFDPLTSLFFLLGFLLLVYRWRRPKYALLLIWFGLGLLPSALSPDAPSTIRLIGVLPIVFLLLGIGVQWTWQQWLFRRAKIAHTRANLVWLPIVLAVVLLTVNVWRTVSDGFIRWPEATETRIRYQSVLQDIAEHWVAHGKPPLVIADSYFEPIDADSLRRTLGYDPSARWVQASDGLPGALVVPKGVGQAYVYVPEFTQLPLDVLAAVGLSQEPAYRSEVHPSFSVYQYRAADVRPVNSANVSFEEAMTFLGYDLLAANEQEIRLLTYWQVDNELPADLTTFVHLVDAQAEIAAQHDGLDAAPQTLEHGDVVVQLHTIPVPAESPNEPFLLQLGLYQRDSERRLSHAGTPADRLIIVDDLLLTKE